jgi:hypothetical protein
LLVYRQADQRRGNALALYAQVELGRRLHLTWQLVRRWAKAAGITTQVCNHTFPSTGFAAYPHRGNARSSRTTLAA